MSPGAALRGLAAKLFGQPGERLLDPDAWRYFGRHLKPRIPKLLGYITAAALQSALTLPVFLLVRHAFDVAIPGKDIGLLIGIGAAIVAFRALNSVIGLALRAFIVRLTKQIIFEIRADLVAKLYSLSRAYHARVDSSLLHARIVQDSERVDHLCNGLFSGILPALLTATTIALFLLYLNWWLLLLGLGILPVLWLANALTGRLVKRHVQAFQKAFEGFSRGTQFVLRHMDLTRFQGYEREELNRQRQTLDQLRETGNRMSMSYALHGHVQRNLTGIAGVILLVAGGIAVANETMTLGAFLAFFLAAGILNGAVDTVLGGIPTIITGNESLVTLNALFGNEADDPYHGSRSIDFDGSIRLSKVDFAYDGVPILRGADLAIEPGKVAVLIGPNGAGKTTIAHLILGFMRPQSGSLSASGVPYDEIDMRELRRAIGVVPQHPTFFTGSVRENICYGRPDATDEDVSAALRTAQAEHYVARLSTGLESAIGENAALTSGGEKQRLAIARALISRPRLLILDEPTNHLDRAAMAALMDALVRLPNRPGILIISHDQAVLRYADAVYELRDQRLQPAMPPPTSEAEHG